MYLKKIEGPRAVELPDGTHMTRADLPPFNTRRWVASRKAAVVKAVAAGLLTQDDALTLYDLSAEEFASWRALAQHHGIKGLKSTKLQAYRQNDCCDTTKQLTDVQTKIASVTCD